MAAETIRKECGVLSTLLNANRRSRVYRHHRFFRRSRHALELAKKCFTGKRSAKPNARSSAKRIESLRALQRCVVRAVEDCISEVAANRIDTVALALACTAVLSRLGCCVTRVAIASNGRDVAARLWPASLVDYAASSTLTSVSTADAAATVPGGRKDTVAKDSYGGVLNTLVRRSGSRRK
jgi:hypothetical protein